MVIPAMVSVTYDVKNLFLSLIYLPDDKILMNVLKAVISAVNYVTILRDHTLVLAMMGIT